MAVNAQDAGSIKAAFPGYSSWNDNAAIVADFAKTQGAGKGGDQASSYLANVNNTVFNAENSPGGGGNVDASLAAFKDKITGGATPPTPPNLMNTFTGLQAQYGLTGKGGLIEQQQGLQTEANNINLEFEKQRATEEAQPVALNVISGRETEEQRQAQIKLDSVNLALNTVTNQINAANTAISAIMQFTEQDYQNAAQYYNDRITQNLNIYGAWSSEMSREQQVAASNLSIISQAVSSGGMHFNSLTPQMQSQINVLENQAGLPIGTIASMNSGEQLLYADSKQIITRDQNGNIQVNKTGRGSGSKTGKTTVRQQLLDNVNYMDNAINNPNDPNMAPGQDGFLSPEAYNYWRDIWTKQQAGTGAQFDSNFKKKYQNPANPNYQY